MTDILLAKPKLPSNFIDCSVGEPYIIREKLFEIFGIDNLNLSKIDYSYLDPAGYKPLIQLLERKHQAPVIITNGAKQGLGAIFYALKTMGKNKVGMRCPWWALIPPLLTMHGLEALPSYEGANANLLLLPNNPDNYISDSQTIESLAQECKEKNVPLIHDAAYYSHIYMPYERILSSLGDVQIFSISKLLGLSSLRLGYVVCHNHEYYKYIQEYMEHMTVGASILSQTYLFELLQIIEAQPTLTKKFEYAAHSALENNKKILKNISSEVLEIPNNIEKTDGMFLWAKTGSKVDFQKSMINVADGAMFGQPGYIRMNIAFDEEKVQEIVKRLNSVVSEQ